jgi:O-antigen/teichoic acid export membrane protein
MFFNVLLSFVAVRLFSIEWWGGIVPYLIIFQLGSFFISWGSQTYLQREFSKDIKKIETIWLDSLISRIPLFVISCLVILILNIPFYYKACIIAWLLLNYGYRSYESLILFRRKFIFSLWLNLIIAIFFISIVIIYKNLLNTSHIIGLYVIFEFVKLVSCIFYFRSDFKNKILFRYSFSTFLICFPFFIQGLIGLLQSRIDTYYVAFSLSKQELAKYHILINLLLLVKAMIDMCLRPFLKNIYRMNIHSLKKISRQFTFWGIFGSIGIVAILYLILTYMYGLKVETYILFMSYLYIIPMYYYATIIYIYYKYNKENIILLFGTLILLVTLILDIILISRFGIFGALTTAVIREWLVLFLYSAFVDKITIMPKDS